MILKKKRLQSQKIENYQMSSRLKIPSPIKKTRKTAILLHQPPNPAYSEPPQHIYLPGTLHRQRTQSYNHNSGHHIRSSCFFSVVQGHCSFVGGGVQIICTDGFGYAEFDHRGYHVLLHAQLFWVQGMACSGLRFDLSGVGYLSDR